MPSSIKAEYALADLLDKNFIGTCSIVLRNHVLEKFPDWFGSLKMLDWPLLAVYAQRGKYGIIPLEMGRYRIHGGGSHSSRSLKERIGYSIAALEFFLKNLDLTPLERAIVWRRVVKCHLNIWKETAKDRLGKVKI